MKVDFFSNKLRLALDTLISLRFAVASERSFLSWVSRSIFSFRSWVPSLYWLSGRCGEFCTWCLGDVNRVVESIRKGEFGRSWNFWEATWCEEVCWRGEVCRRDCVFGETKFYGGGICRKEHVDGVHVDYWNFILLKKVKHVLLNLFLSPEDALCAIPKHAMVLYTMSIAAIFFEIFGCCHPGFIHFTGSRSICLRVTFI